MLSRERGLLVVGASLAGLRAAESARKTGYRGPITLLGAEEEFPYDRPPLSKAYLAEGAARGASTFPGAHDLSDRGIQLVLGEPAQALDLSRNAVITDRGTHPYDTLVIATGAEPRPLAVRDRLAGVHTLRSHRDALAVRDALDARPRVVVVGGGFIGAEVASAARRRGLEATILEAASVPLVRALGPEMAAICLGIHAGNGTAVQCGVEVVGFAGDNQVSGVQLSDGRLLPCELVVVGVGASPATGWLEGSGLDVEDGVVCDEHLRTSAPGVFAAGDVARWLNPAFDEVMRLENWTAAAEQGAHAGRNAVGPGPMAPYSTVPYFWSDWYDTRLQFAGISADAEVDVVDGSVDAGRFVALYRRGDRLSGVLAVNRPSEVMKYRALIARRTSWLDALEFAERRKAGAPDASFSSPAR